MSYTSHDELLDLFEERAVACDGDMADMIEEVVRRLGSRFAEHFTDNLWECYEGWIRVLGDPELAQTPDYIKGLAGGLRLAATEVSGYA